jgi:lipopolysaccharide/colanic/teichoic acid biosynthesis glycosyltransferase
MYKHFFKRFFDFTVSLACFIVLLPVFVVITVILHFANGGKSFFVQKRPGKDGQIFKVIKFKTMNDWKDSNGIHLPDYKRITKVGNFIRKSSLDEIPQLLNVIKGDMSLVGPRPLLMGYLPLYNKEQKRRHEVRPGITGWAQINGRNTISWADKFKFDVYYVDNLSFLLDLTILLITIKKVFTRDGINAKANTTMESFMGND